MAASGAGSQGRLMPWARLDDSYFTHRKVAALSKDAKLLDLAGIAFSARELRNGELTRTDIRMIAAQVDVEDYAAVALELVKAGRWSRSDGGYTIHDYLKYNPSREQVLHEREMNAQRVEKWREKHKDTDPPPSRNGITPGITGTISNGPRTDTPYPYPLTSTSTRESVREAPPREEVTEDFKQELENEFCEQLGSRETVRAHIDAALAHTSRLKYTDDRAYLRRWLRDDATRASAGPHRRNGVPEPVRHIRDNTGKRMA
jgi:hypothetical protein